MKMLHMRTRQGCTLLFLIMLVTGCNMRDIQQQETTQLASAILLPFEKVLPGPVSDYEVLRTRNWDRGEYAQEFILEVFRLPADGLKMENKKGISTAFHKAWLIVRNVKTQRGWAVSLAYSGNWRMTITQQGTNSLLRVTTLPESLKPFKTINGLPIPGALITEFMGHWDNGAQLITRFIRSKLLRDLGGDWPWVQYNTWYDRAQELDEGRLIELARVAAELGCELFVIDAGWYGLHPDWSESLGDWC